METFVGNTVKLILETGIDLTGYTTLRVRYIKPDKTYGSWIAALSPTDNTWLEYTTLITDLNIPGTWVVQAHVTDIGQALHGKWADFMVYTPIP